jgi:hydrogenase/urease accessory protein HupE
VNRPHVDYYVGSGHGVNRRHPKIRTAGIHHILIGPDHLLFLVGLLLLGGFDSATGHGRHVVYGCT